MLLIDITVQLVTLRYVALCYTMSDAKEALFIAFILILSGQSFKKKKKKKKKRIKTRT